MDCDWLDPLNSLLDDNKILRLEDSGESVKLHPSVSIVILTDNAQVASPAHVSRLTPILFISEEEFYRPTKFSEIVAMKLQELGSEDYLLNKKRMMALAMVHGFIVNAYKDNYWGPCNDESFMNTAAAVKNLVAWNPKVIGLA